MKSIEEFKEMLESDLNLSIPAIRNLTKSELYYNQYLDGVSYKLVALLEIHLRKDGNEWDRAKWMDDCLITDVWLTERELSLGGIVVWGIGGTTEQWTEPFFFEVAHKNYQVDFFRYLFLFGDRNKEAVSYTKFNKNRSIWNQDDRDWQYIIEIG
jgi:hypothetical protein